MKLQLVLFVSLLTIIVAGVASAEWKWSNEEFQEFKSFDGYVIAAGTKRPVDVNASDIEKALLDGKEIRLRNAKIVGNIKFAGEVKQAVYFIDTTFSGEAIFSHTLSEKADFGYAKFSESVSFRYAKFSEGADFRYAEFLREAIFRSAEFSEEGVASFNDTKFLKDAAYFGKTKFLGQTEFRRAKFLRARFREAEFSRETDFLRVEFSEKADFSHVRFSGSAGFSYVKFSRNADFRYAKFSGGVANFRYAEFSEGWANFEGTKFLGAVNFMDAKFLGRRANFGNVEFSGKANFWNATFSEITSFSECHFRRLSDFRGCLYPENVLLFSIDSKFHSDLDRENIPADLRRKYGDNENITISIRKKGSSWRMTDGASKKTFLIRKEDGKLNVYEEVKISFDNVTGFSQMLIEWKYDVKLDAKLYSADNLSKTPRSSIIKRRGLKGHFKYNETFYIALIKNYQNIGWFSQADDVYYTYRREKRIRSSLWRRVAELILEIPFGYGVKPLRLLCSFLILWLPFSFYYTGFLRYPDKWILSGIRPWNPVRDRFRCFAWALIYSLDNLTPGIDLHPLRFLEASPYIFTKAKSRKVIWVKRMQQILGWYLLALFVILFGKIWIR